MDDIKQFTAKMSTDPAFSCDIVPKFYLNASLALWYDLVFDFDCCIGALSLIFFLFPEYAQLHVFSSFPNSSKHNY